MLRLPSFTLAAGLLFAFSAQAKVAIDICRSGLEGGPVITYEPAERCRGIAECRFDWGSYYGKRDLPFTYDRYFEPTPATRKSPYVFRLSVMTETQARGLQRGFDPLGVLTEARELTLARALATGKPQFSWVRLESGSEGILLPFKAQPAPMPEADPESLSFDDQALTDAFDELPPLPADRTLHGYSLIIASPLPNEPPSPFELTLSEVFHQEACRTAGGCPTTGQFVHVVKVSPAATPDGSRSSVFTYSPTF
jgi:hypothetical protein